MKQYKKLRSAVCGASLFLLLASKAYSIQSVEIVTYNSLPPYAYSDTKEGLSGIYVEIVRKAISRMPNYNVSFKVLPWVRAKLEVEHGKAFAILPPYFHAHDWLTKDEPQRPYIWPYSLPLFTQTDVVVCNSKVMQQPRNNFPEDYRKLKFVMSRGDGRAGEHFTQLVENKEIDMSYVSDIEHIIMFLMAGRADCTVTSKHPFNWYMSKVTNQNSSPEDNQFVEAAIISKNEGYLGYTDINVERNFPFKKDFVIKFDIEIYQMKKNGEIQEIIDSFLSKM